MVRKGELTEYLENRGRFDKNTDGLLMDELYYNIKVMKASKKSLKDGFTVSGSKDGTIIHPHPAIKTYNTALSMVLTISSRLGLSHGDRVKMGIASESKDNDGFEDDE